ncbi:alpha/beta fold hydrolase [Haloferula chungangensis]|uniref:Alpha/beta fold hydrolase n=1 Tax=Haloferula chungangensis TaxID=1048331 RepID=A0ABW2LB18_9BACT
MNGTIWCLHGAVGMAEDWKGFSVPGWAVKRVDLWRFLDCCPMSMPGFGAALNREVEATEGVNVLLGYSMGGRLALHALLEGGPWAAAVIVSAHPGLEDEGEKAARRASDAEWAAKALKGDWKSFLDEWNAQSVLGPARELGGNRQLLLQRRQAVARSFMDWTLGEQQALGGRLAEIDCPLRWCVGERDAKFRALGEKTVDSSQLWVAEGAGHRLPWEAREAFAKMVGEFLEQALS